MRYRLNSAQGQSETDVGVLFDRIDEQERCKTDMEGGVNLGGMRHKSLKKDNKERDQCLDSRVHLYNVLSIDTPGEEIGRAHV